jgi:uroporphyrin-III C-methyltransferase/precorrin-2 dehydrogenase/sirohydrochlorin ferrochelatase
MSLDSPVFPVFLKLGGRKAVVVGGGSMATSKLAALLRSGADVTVVSPRFSEEIEASGVTLLRRGFESEDLEGAWYAVAAATPEVNRRVAAAAAERRIFVNAVDDPANASAYLGGVLRSGDLTIAISTEGQAPAVAGLLREALEELLPKEIATWLDEAQRQKRVWREERVPMISRRPLMLAALNRLYKARGEFPSEELPPEGA